MRLTISASPATIADEVELETLLSEPTDRVVQMMVRLDGGGTMGPTLARMARRAADLDGGPRRVAVESDVLRPAGEYAMICLGRERIFEHFSRTPGIRVTIVRLN